MAASQMPGLRGDLLLDEPLARYTSWRVGGPARQLYRPADVADLVAFLQGLPADEPLLWLGLGSNLLVRDGGFRGTVIVTQGRLNDIQALPGERIRAEAGAACAHVARLAARLGLCGAAFLAGIPGTMGGALAMNAGAFGGETWERVLAVQTVDRQGTLRRRTPDDYRVAYRQVQGPAGEWFLACELQLAAGDSQSEQLEIKRLLARRGATQPTRQPSGGSTFRNPPGDFAARLIEQAGLKGHRIGGAEVSEKHANFVVNTGAATAADIEELIDHMQRVVARRFGVQLQREVLVVGEPA
jgi:UDP-N-acetylmuramate dehydrogenase